MSGPEDGRANDRVLLVDEQDREVGTEDKLVAHQLGALHRAFSAFVFDGAARALLQRRAAGKYHSAGLWSNACCSHPRPGETPAGAAHRRLQEEMGFDCPLAHAFTFLYRAQLDHGLTEHELDHVFVGTHQDTLGAVRPDSAEVSAWRWATTDEIEAELAATPQRFTVWFRIAWPMLRERMAREGSPLCSP